MLDLPSLTIQYSKWKCKVTNEEVLKRMGDKRTTEQDPEKKTKSDQFCKKSAFYMMSKVQ